MLNYDENIVNLLKTSAFITNAEPHYCGKDRMYLILDPSRTNRATKMGLHNQMICIMNSIELARQLDRDLLVPNFAIQYDTDRTISISKILNIPFLNRHILAKRGYKMRVCADLEYRPQNITYVPGWRKNGWMRQTDEFLRDVKSNFNSVQFVDVPRHMMLFDPGYGFEFTLPFQDVFYRIARKFMNERNLTRGQFNALHFRVEDDILQSVYKGLSRQMNLTGRRESRARYYYFHFFMQYILQKLSNNRTTPLFVAVGDETNLLSFAVPYLRAHFPAMHITPKSGVFTGRSSLPEGRELYAIIDTLIAAEAGVFVGNRMSSLSAMVANMHRLASGGRQSNTHMFFVDLELMRVYVNTTSDTDIVRFYTALQSHLQMNPYAALHSNQTWSGRSEEFRTWGEQEYPWMPERRQEVQRIIATYANEFNFPVDRSDS
jgi:hypothetical protein